MALNRRFRLIAQDFSPLKATTAQLEDVSDDVNISGLKELGQQVYNTTTTKPVYAQGTTPGSVWKDATGATVHTPV